MKLLEAYESLLQSLWERMALMLGRVTTRTLMERSIFETAKDFPIVNDISLSESGVDFSQLESNPTLSDDHDQELKEAFNALVVNLVGVLAEQVGKRMADQIAGRMVTSHGQ